MVQIELNWVTFIAVISEWLLFSVSLWMIAKKIGMKEAGLSFAPGWRFFALGEAIGLNREGRAAGIMDLIFFFVALSRMINAGTQVNRALSLINLIIFLFFFLYRIRLFFQILNIFGLKKRWVLLWLIAMWLPMMIIGFGKKYQPREDFQAAEQWEAGFDPAEIPEIRKAEEAFASRPVPAEGLSVDLRERTVKDNRKKRYLLKDIFLRIPNSSMVLLLGGSGSGKTTLINAVIGYEKADASVFLNGSDVYKDYDSVKHRLGFVPQQNLIRGNDTVRKTIQDAAAMRLPKNLSREESNDRISSVMELLGLTSGCDGLVSKKSGGQLRRISIGMELVTDPELFVLDEPDSGLDGAIAREIFRELRSIADEGKIVIVITHTPDRVIDLFDKVIVLARDSGRVGRLAFYGTPQEARDFFEKDTMEEVVMSINSKDEGGEGLADRFIEQYARYEVLREAGEAV